MTTSRTYLAAVDRVELCDLFDVLGPAAPTLCEGWTTHDLAAHLVAREHRPDSVPGLVLPALAGWTERVRLGERRRRYADLVAALRSGPPVWWLSGMVPETDRLSNTHEFFVHHEDVRRAQEPWEPRPLDAEAEADLWRVLGWFARRAFAKAPVGVTLHCAVASGRAGGSDVVGGAEHVARKPRPRQSVVDLTGPPGELLLYTFGRREHARVDLEGSDEAVAALSGAELSW